MKDEDFSDGIYWVLNAVDYKLGGGHDASSGIDYRNDVFETFSFWNHCECDCTYLTREMDWEDNNPHAEDCYQSLIRDLGFGHSWDTELDYEEQKRINEEVTRQVCVALGIDPEAPGRWVHCTCGRRERWQEWVRTTGHDPECSLQEIGFRHFASGLEVSWYKRVGRSTESNKGLKTLEWFKIVVECLESVRDDD